MVNVTARPRSPRLLPFVKSFHYHETEMPLALERIVPNGQAHLMVNLAEDEFRCYDRASATSVRRHTGAVLAGPHSQSTILDTREQQWLAAVEFRCGGAAPFVPMPMGEVSNQIVSLSHLWRTDGAHLPERLRDAGTPHAMFAVLEEMLLSRLGQAFDPAIAFAVAALQRRMPVSEVATRLGLLPNTFVRRFTAKVGITPKRFARVRRMQRAMRSIRTAPPADWSLLAVEHGYADQSHLVHEFREFSGVTPTTYEPHSPRRSNHIPLPAQ
jgi:AraC-like DNA-binding protein